MLVKLSIYSTYIDHIAQTGPAHSEKEYVEVQEDIVQERLISCFTKKKRKTDSARYGNTQIQRPGKLSRSELCLRHPAY